MHPGVAREQVQETCGWTVRSPTRSKKRRRRPNSSSTTLRDLQARTKAAHEGAAKEGADMAEAFICDYIRTPDRPLRRRAVGGPRRRSRRHAVEGAGRSATPASTGEPSTTSSSAAPTRPARTTAMSRAWRCCWPACPSEVPGTTINRLCGSGMDAVIAAARAIKAGEAELMIAGGVESMSRAPFVMPKADDGVFAQRRDLRHDDRLALRQPADEEAVRRRFHAGDRRERRRGFLGLARRPGRLRRAQPEQGRRRAGQWPSGARRSRR